MNTARGTAKKLILVILSAVMLLTTFGVTAGANETTYLYDRLTEMGFSEDFLDCITEEMMKNIILVIGDAEIVDLIYNDNDHPRNDSDESDFNIEVKSVKAILYDKSTERISGECVCIYWKWKNGRPIAKQKDRVEIKWSNPDFLYDGISFYAEDYEIKGRVKNVSNTYTALAETKGPVVPAMAYYSDLKAFGGQNGGCAVFNLVASKPMTDIAEAENDVSISYTHYYKATVFAICVSCMVVAAAVIIFCSKSRRSKKTQASSKSVN